MRRCGRATMAGGGGLLSMTMVWSQALYAKAGPSQGQTAFAAAPTAQSAHPSSSIRPDSSSSTTTAVRGSLASNPDQQHPKSQLIFIGSGSSSGVPTPFRLLHPDDSRQSAINQLAVATPPEVNKNYRGNTSVLVRVVRNKKSSDGGDHDEKRQDSNAVVGRAARPIVEHVQIDTGKTWREGVIRWFPRHGIPGVDAIVLTHDHADAILGLDDVRGIQDPRKRRPTPVFVSEKTNRSVKRVFPYLVGREEDNGAGGRYVAALQFHVIKDFQPFQVGELEVTAFPVLHGEDYVSHGFLFGPEGNKICYISDVSRVPPESMTFLRKQGPLQLLVCDALTRDRKHPTHFCVEDSVELARELQPRRTFLVGLGSDIEYAATNAVLTRGEQEDGDPCVRLAYDGLAVDIDLD